MELAGFGVCVLVGEFKVEVSFWLCWIQLSVINTVEKLSCNQSWRKEKDIMFSYDIFSFQLCLSLVDTLIYSTCSIGEVSDLEIKS